jgi:hypothetical protein
MTRWGFGKHREDLVVDVIKNDTTYVTWLVREAIVTLSDEAYETYRRECDDRGLEP